jgi:hypothetical protein
MPQQTSATLAFNRGVLSTLGLARIDLTRYRMAAASMSNWMARVLGSMMIRPGWAYLGNTAGNNQAKTIPFIFGATDTARIEITQGTSRIWVNDALVTRAAVGTTVTNGSFPTNLAGWTNSSEAGATVSWVSAGQVSFVGTGSNNAILDQQINVAGPDQSTRQALRIVITAGPMSLRIGTSMGDDSIVNETVLNTGTHSIALTPGAASFWVRFQSSGAAASLLASCNIESAGVLTLPTPWQTQDLYGLRSIQSADVVFVGASGYPQQQFERRAIDSWSIVDYSKTCNVGPFRPINVTNIQLTPSAVSGNITLTSNKPFFKPGHVGALFRLLSIGQAVTSALAGANQFTNPVLVTGVGAQRNLTITISGTWSGTIVLQYSVGTSAGPWIDVGSGHSWTGNLAGGVYADGSDNQAIYYRLGFEALYTSGTATASLAFPFGSITGIARVTGYTSSTQVNAAVLQAMGNTTATPNWSEGSWSTFRGFPATPMLWQGRLWWFGVSVFGSSSDNYNNFDDTILGDSAPIIGQLNEGPVENVYWAVGLQQLVLGTASAEPSLRSTYLGDPVTPTNFNVMTGSTQGSANVNALRMDRSGVFVQVTGQRVFTLDLDIYTYSYRSNELTLLVPDFNSAGIVMMAIQRKPDTRIHCVRADGTVGVMVYDQTENVTCWLAVSPANTIAGSGFVEDVTVLPGSGQAEDQVYYTVRRVINGQTVRFHEKWAMETEVAGTPSAKISDACTVYVAPPGVTTSVPATGRYLLENSSGYYLQEDGTDYYDIEGFISLPGTTTITGAVPWLAGETVCLWGWNTVAPYIDANGNTAGLDLGTYVVDATGSISGINQGGVPFPITNAVIGLPYTAQWQSMKESFAAALGTPLNQPKRIDKLGLILQNTHAQGIKIGSDFQHLDDLPQSDLPVLASGMADLNAILNGYDRQMSAFNDVWSTDSRVCLQAVSPRPCTCLAFTTEMTTSG